MVGRPAGRVGAVSHSGVNPTAIASPPAASVTALCATRGRKTRNEPFTDWINHTANTIGILFFAARKSAITGVLLQPDCEEGVGCENDEELACLRRRRLIR